MFVVVYIVCKNLVCKNLPPADTGRVNLNLDHDPGRRAVHRDICGTRRAGPYLSGIARYDIGGLVIQMSLFVYLTENIYDCRTDDIFPFGIGIFISLNGLKRTHIYRLGY